MVVGEPSRRLAGASPAQSGPPLGERVEHRLLGDVRGDGPTLEPATRYLAACGAARRAQSLELVRALDRHAGPVAAQGRVLAGAREAFRRALVWFRGR